MTPPPIDNPHADALNTRILNTLIEISRSMNSMVTKISNLNRDSSNRAQPPPPSPPPPRRAINDADDDDVDISVYKRLLNASKNVIAAGAQNGVNQTKQTASDVFSDELVTINTIKNSLMFGFSGSLKLGNMFSRKSRPSGDAGPDDELPPRGDPNPPPIPPRADPDIPPIPPRADSDDLDLPPEQRDFNEDQLRYSRRQAEMADKALERGSIYTHDIHVESTLSEFTDILKNFMSVQSNDTTKIDLFNSIDQTLSEIKIGLSSPTSTFFSKMFEPMQTIWDSWFSINKTDTEVHADKLTSIKDMLTQIYDVSQAEYTSSTNYSNSINKLLLLHDTLIKSSIGMFNNVDKSNSNEEQTEKIQVDILTQIRDSIFNIIDYNEDERKRRLREGGKVKKSEGLGILDYLGFAATGALTIFKEIKNFAKSLKSLKMLDVFKNVISFIKTGTTSILGKLGVIGKWILNAGSSISKVFSGIRSAAGGTLSWFSKIGKSISSVGKYVSTIFKSISSFGNSFKFLSKFLAGAKVLPVIGWIISGVTALFDFFDGFTNTEGSFFDKLVGGFKSVMHGIQDIFIKLPLQALEWITSKVAGLFGIDIAPGWADKATQWIKDLSSQLLDWLLSPAKSLYNLFFGDKKTPETDAKNTSFIDKFKDFFLNFWTYTLNWIKNNPLAKGIDYVWEKLTGASLFDSSSMRQPEEKPVSIDKSDKKGDLLSNIDAMKDTAIDELSKKKDETLQSLKDMTAGLASIGDRLSEGVSSAVNSMSSNIQNVMSSTINNTEDASPNKIPEGIESLGLMLKNSTWGF